MTHIYTTAVMKLAPSISFSKSYLRITLLLPSCPTKQRFYLAFTRANLNVRSPTSERLAEFHRLFTQNRSSPSSKPAHCFRQKKALVTLVEDRTQDRVFCLFDTKKDGKYKEGIEREHTHKVDYQQIFICMVKQALDT